MAAYPVLSYKHLSKLLELESVLLKNSLAMLQELHWSVDDWPSALQLSHFISLCDLRESHKGHDQAKLEENLEGIDWKSQPELRVYSLVNLKLWGCRE